MAFFTAGLVLLFAVTLTITLLWQLPSIRTDLRDRRRKRTNYSFHGLSSSQQKEILSNNYCNRCGTDRLGKYDSEIERLGEPHYKLSCTVCEGDILVKM